MTTYETGGRKCYWSVRFDDEYVYHTFKVRSKQVSKFYRIMDVKENVRKEERITIDNRYELEQEVYVITKEKKTIFNKKTCDMCFGIGRIVHRGIEATCPMCYGHKDITLDSKTIEMYVVDPKPHTITSIRYSITRGGTFLRYRLNGFGSNNKNIPEENIFATKEEAIAACERLNELSMVTES